MLYLGLDSTEYQLIEPNTPSDPTLALSKLEELSTNMIRIASEFKKAVDQAKELCARQVDRLQREKDSAVLAARVEAQVAALQPDGSGTLPDSTLQPALDNEHQKKVRYNTKVFVLRIRFNDLLFLVCEL